MNGEVMTPKRRTGRSMRLSRLLEFWEEDNGRLSSVRLFPTLILIASIGFGIYACATDNAIATDLSKHFLGAGGLMIGVKAYQKQLEEKP
jgi:preprotein translocase subunit Sec61beta